MGIQKERNYYALLTGKIKCFYILNDVFDAHDYVTMFQFINGMLLNES